MDISSTSSSSSSSGQSWISWFVSLSGHQFLVSVDEEFITDNFNLYGLRSIPQISPFYESALEMILSDDLPEEEDLEDDEYLAIYKAAVDLYGLIHARFLLTTRGLQLVREKFNQKQYGTCPRVLCEDQNCLPIAVSEFLRKETVKIYCPKCKQIYSPRPKTSGDLDGAYFGCSLPGMYLLTYPSTTPGAAYIPRYFAPRTFGFKVHGAVSIVQKKLIEESTIRPGVEKEGIKDSE
jgi:casein kinase II subunit beta